jgi:hypothetical protein
LHQHLNGYHSSDWIKRDFCFFAYLACY